jgi:hypothetical protein
MAPSLVASVVKLPEDVSIIERLVNILIVLRHLSHCHRPANLIC